MFLGAEWSEPEYIHIYVCVCEQEKGTGTIGEILMISANNDNDDDDDGDGSDKKKKEEEEKKKRRKNIGEFPPHQPPSYKYPLGGYYPLLIHTLCVCGSFGSLNTP